MWSPGVPRGNRPARRRRCWAWPRWCWGALSGSAAQSNEVFYEGDIIVSARRRDETAQDTPVALTVLNDALLDRYGVKGVASIQSLTPGLYTGESSGAMGGTISLRGVGSGDTMAFIDQAVDALVHLPLAVLQVGEVEAEGMKTGHAQT